MSQLTRLVDLILAKPGRSRRAGARSEGYIEIEEFIDSCRAIDSRDRRR